MPVPLIMFPDVELLLTAYLRAALLARSQVAYVGTAVPSPRAARMVVVRRDGGPRLDAVREAARMSVRVWGTSEQDATDLARLVRALIGACPTGAPVVRAVELSGPSAVADDSGQPLRFMTFELTVRGIETT